MRCAIAAMAAAFALPITAEAGEPGLVVYHCVNEKDQAKFALTYELDGSKISNVAVGYHGVPRLGSDVGTHWRGQVAGDDVMFNFKENSKGFSIVGSMKLVKSSAPGHFTLTWEDTSGGGHIYMTSQESSADCVFPDFEHQQSMSQ